MDAQYPHLFDEITWPWGPTRVRFEARRSLPPENLIANVNVLPYRQEHWLMIRLADGSWDLPGGTLEAGESWADAAARELAEEAGVWVSEMHLLGTWFCRSESPTPYRPHLPFPEFYRLVLLGPVAAGVRAAGMNEAHTTSGHTGNKEKILRVDYVPVHTAAERFLRQNRPELSDLYRMAEAVRSQLPT